MTVVDLDTHRREKIGGSEAASESDCILYAGRLSDRGYAQVWVGGRTVRLHRHMYESFVGPIPEGHEIHHRCGVKHCLNTDHMEALTHADHMRLHDPLATTASRAKTHCANGHARTPENLYVAPKTGLRACRICRRANRRASDQRKREATG